MTNLKKWSVASYLSWEAKDLEDLDNIGMLDTFLGRQSDSEELRHWTVDRRQRHGLQKHTNNGPLCDQECESYDHLLAYCSFTMEVRYGTRQWRSSRLDYRPLIPKFSYWSLDRVEIHIAGKYAKEVWLTILFGMLGNNGKEEMQGFHVRSSPYTTISIQD